MHRLRFASNLSLPIRALCDALRVSHLAHVSPLSRWVLPYPAASVRDLRTVRVAFRLPAFASWAILSRWSIGSRLRSTYSVQPRLQRGFQVPLMRDATGLGVSFAPGPWVSLGARRIGSRLLGGSSGYPPPSGPFSPSLSPPFRRSSSHGASAGDSLSFTRPVFPSPWRFAAAFRLGAFPSASHPPVARRACDGGD